MAAAMGMSRRCVQQWIRRYRPEGDAGCALEVEVLSWVSPSDPDAPAIRACSGAGTHA
ncbi:helix-turn-helix domain-containing protein [Arthrobacter sp. OV608]|uniref:helix-turn-helix domain-containing protein n=1 Tax=Arthrobacter sp. OV608 TaxID=1882768 RepID=UPI00336A10F8